jgi:hypothetical protein
MRFCWNDRWKKSVGSSAIVRSGFASPSAPSSACSNRSARTPACRDLLNDDEIQAKLDRLARYTSRIERTFHRSLKELKALQTNQAVGALMPRDIVETAPPLASAIEIAKRTQAAVGSWPLKSPDAVDLEWIGPTEAPQAAQAAHAT